MSRSRNWMFTYNNPEAPPSFPEDSSYAFQLERGEQGTPHYQGYLVLKLQTTLSALVKKYPGMHWEPRRGTHQEAFAYVTKEDTRLEPPIIHNMEPQSRERERSDLSDARQSLLGKRTWSEVTLDPSLDSVRAKYPVWTRDTFLALSNQVEPNLEFEFIWEWQRNLLEILSGPVDPRKIYWVSETIGNTGKSWMANHLFTNHGAFLSTGGKTADIAFAYDRQPIAVFDLSRCREEQTPYQVLENLKDGRIFSPKYESCMKIFPPPHVVVFANFKIPDDKLSSDRIVYITPNK